MTTSETLVIIRPHGVTPYLYLGKTTDFPSTSFTKRKSSQHSNTEFTQIGYTTRKYNENSLMTLGRVIAPTVTVVTIKGRTCTKYEKFFHLLSSVKYNFMCNDFHETRKSSSALREDIPHRILSKYVKKNWKTVGKSLTL